MNSSMVVRSAAKVNLTLDVLGLRADGYHELRSIVHTIGLWDTIRFDFKNAHGLTFSCDQSDLQTDDNLCLKAARLWSQSANRVLDCAIRLEKQIPMGAGLGGGSGNAAATLLVLNRHFDDALSEDQLHYIAAKLGADVPLFLRGGCNLIEGVGEKITSLRSLSGWILLLQPHQKLSTPQVFRAWDELHSHTNLAMPDASTHLLNLMQQNATLAQLAMSLRNDLTAAAARCGVDVGPALQKLREFGALGATMTGSGSAFYAFFDTEKSARDALQNMEYPDGAAISVWDFTAVAPFSAHGIEWLD